MRVIATRRARPTLASQAPMVNKIAIKNVFGWLDMERDRAVKRVRRRIVASSIKRDIRRWER